MILTTTWRSRWTSIPSLMVFALVPGVPVFDCFWLCSVLVLLSFVFIGSQVYWSFPHLTTHVIFTEPGLRTAQ